MNAIANRIFVSYDFSNSTPLSDLLLQLLNEQKRIWPMAADGYASLQNAQIREVKCSTFSVWLQFNPKRIISTGAKVDAQSINSRQCFLCIDHLPPEQKGVLYENDFLVLCNPMPIFPAHYTVSHLNHLPQFIEPYLATFLRLARDLSPQFTVFYNGAQCGASAPDHIHFQIAPAGKIPIEQEAVEAHRRERVGEIDGVATFLLRDLGRAVIVFEGTNSESVTRVVREQLAKMKATLNIADEPKINVICNYNAPQWRVILFPRRQHRPEVFFKEGDDKVVISPASVDMGGLIITPLEKDFNTVDANMIEEIYREVSWDEAMVRKMLLG
ncbi:MAG: DUF4922 domain-containing protein [candidate division KSB1 bacterium]|nr:DUF4922 domain-containing protein [candidate division KSB1 bacterium]MDZ7367977.1 DUF4922 domain-containing protein [candidate division KSB1 bacterium]MDZ7405600.1 DUF4922 domain-containing protein [candidate division KSB1 bacterium]